MTKRRRTIKTRIACSQTSELQKDVPFLPKDIIVNILSRLPANFLHNHARYVCKTWADILHLPSFTKSSLLPSNCVLLVQDRYKPYDAWFLEMGKGKLEMTGAKLRFPGRIQDSSGGVLLITTYIDFQTFYVANPVTMQVVKLPHLSVFVTCVGSSIAYIPHTGELMVVCVGRDINKTCHWYILTVGSNMSWRKIDSTVPGCDPKVCFDSITKSISAGGVLYWENTSWNLDHRILALDLRDETMHYFLVPNEFCDVHSYLLKMGNYLGCISWGNTGPMKICLLKDLHQNEWAITYRFDLNEKSHIHKHCSVPLACLENHQIMIFLICTERREVYMEFNWKTGKWKYMKNIDGFHQIMGDKKFNWKTGKWNFVKNIGNFQTIIAVHSDSLFLL